MSEKPSRPSFLTDSEEVLLDATETAPCFSATTGEVTVSVRIFWLDDQSFPEERRFAWAYHITIENNGRETLQLLSRSWKIVDGCGHIEHVHGEGVVGEQPIITPKSRYEYTSGAMLKTPSGFMNGLYHMLCPTTSERFDVVIPAFSLDSPHDNALIH